MQDERAGGLLEHSPIAPGKASLTAGKEMSLQALEACLVVMRTGVAAMFPSPIKKA